MIAYRQNPGATRAVVASIAQPVRLATRDLRRRHSQRPVASAAPETVSLLRSIEAAMDRHDIPPTRFGREAVSDPRLVFDLRNGCTITDKRKRRVIAFLTQLEGGADMATNPSAAVAVAVGTANHRRFLVAASAEWRSPTFSGHRFRLTSDRPLPKRLRVPHGLIAGSVIADAEPADERTLDVMTVEVPHGI